MSHPAHIHRRQLLAWLGAALGSTGLAFSGRAAGKGGQARYPAVVVELFTSQGCSACPPADALLAELVDEPDVLGIGYNIDAWDYLGWRDTLARPEFTRRQRMYAAARGDDAVYTPQMIINGRTHVLGNDRARVRAAIEQARRHGGCQQVKMKLQRHDRTLQVDITAQPKAEKTEATLWIVTMRNKVAVHIRHGENRGRQITYHHVARSIVPAAMWHGAAQRLTLPLQEVMRDTADACAVILQRNSHGPIIAAGVL